MSSGAAIPAGVIVWTEAERFNVLAAFYEETLGLEASSKRPGHVAFSGGGVRLTVGVHDGVHGRSQEPLRIMINLAVADIHATVASLRAEGVPFMRTPELEPWGGWIATLSDPDGNTVQLLQFPQESA